MILPIGIMGAVMSCYFRHMQYIFIEAGIQVTPTNRKQIDLIIHEIVKAAYKNCPAAWKAIRLDTTDRNDREDFIQKLKTALGIVPD